MPETLRVVIVDDEALARQGLRGYLRGEPDVELVAECGSGTAAVEAISRHRPDLVFLDVQMPGMDAFDVLRAVPEDVMPALVFVTAYDEYAVRAFEVNAVDYLLKPYDRERFQAALARARRRTAEDRHALPDRLTRLLATLEPSPRVAERFLVRTGGRVHFVSADDVEWIEAADNYVRLHVDGRALPFRSTMTRLAETLSATAFVRVHRSAIVRIDRIRELRPLASGDAVLVLASGATVTLSRGYRDRFHAQVGTMG